MLKIFKIDYRSLRGHKWVKGQIFKNAPIELKFVNNDPYDILSILDISSPNLLLLPHALSDFNQTWSE